VPHVDTLIVGGGFGGALAARTLERKMRGRRHRAAIVSPENFLLFSPLLPEAASGTIEPRHAVIPLRELLKTTEVVVGRVTAFDPDNRTAVVVNAIGETREVTFDSAVIAPGSVPATFPIPGLIEHAVGFKTLQDAIWLRNRVLRQLDAAEVTPDPALRRELLTFTFVGGGYAGVEALAELDSLARDAVRAYGRLGRNDMRWVLIEAQDSLLPGLASRLAAFTRKVLTNRGVEVYTGTRLTSCVDSVVETSDPSIPPYRSGTIVWTAGQRPADLAAAWGLPTTESGFVPVDSAMRIAGHHGLYAVGDFAAVPDPDGGIAPSTAQHAMRQAVVAGTNVAADAGVGTPTTFTYRNRGLAVTLGKRQGTAQVKSLTFTGPLAWWMGRSYHLLMMPGIGRKVRIVFDWTISLFFRRDVSQLGQLGTPSPLD
jgi:NADH dehydrogenase